MPLGFFFWSSSAALCLGAPARYVAFGNEQMLTNPLQFFGILS